MYDDYQLHLVGGGQQQVFITDVNFNEDGVLIVWVQADASKYEEIVEMSKTLQRVAPMLHVIPHDQLEQGKLCCCLFEVDSRWNRACAKKKLENGQWLVQSIDYGYYQIVDELSCCRLPDGLSKLPKQATGVILSKSFQPINSAGLWTSKACDILLNMLWHVSVQVNVIEATKDGLFVVDCPTITNIVVENNIAKYCPLEGCYPYSKFKIGTSVLGCVSAITDQNCVFIQEHDFHADLQILKRRMICYYGSSFNKLLLPTTDQKTGMLAAAICELCCVRVQIRRVCGDFCIVHLIDYGDLQKVRLNSLFVLAERFCDLPFQAIGSKFYDQRSLDDSSNFNKYLNKCENAVVNIEIIGHYFGSLARLAIKLKERFYNQSTVVGLQSALKYKYPSVDLNSNCKMAVLHVKSDGVFYLAFSRFLPNLCKLMDDLLVYGNHTNSETVKTFRIGQPCCAFNSKNKHWYRAKIIEINGNMCRVFYVDYGYTDVCLSSALKEIKQKHLELCCQAIECQVAKHLDLDSSEVEKLQSLVNEEVVVDFVGKFLDSFVVKLSHDDVVLFSSAPKSPDKVEGMIATAEASSETIASLPTTMLPSVTLEVFYYFSITCVIDPDCIWVKQRSCENLLYDLSLDLNRFYDNLMPGHMMVTNPCAGDICCVKSVHRSENWYRALVLSARSDLVQVRLIDHGDIMVVKTYEMRNLAPRFCLINAQAIKCKLANVKPKSEKWTVLAKNVFIALTKVGTVVYGKFSGKQDDCYLADFYVHYNKDKNLNISSILVDKGYASWIGVPFVEDLCLSRRIEKLNETAAILPSKKENDETHLKKKKILYPSPGFALLGAEMEVFVDDFSSPDEFFITIKENICEKLYAELFKNLNEHCNRHFYDEDMLIKPKELYFGMPCCLFYAPRSQWCRGTVLKHHDITALSICLIDIGDVVETQLNSLRHIKPDFVKQAYPAALRCTMQGIISPIGGTWSMQALQRCWDFLQNNKDNLTLTVYGCARDVHGTLFTCNLQTPLVDLKEELVKFGEGKTVLNFRKELLSVELMTYFYSNLGLTKGAERHFYVCHIKKPDTFYCQLPSECGDRFVLMTQALQKHCNERKHEHAKLQDLLAERKCFVKYNDGLWYRAHFISYHPDGMCTVFYVDYGNTECTHLKNVLSFADETFLDLPIQALACCIKDLVLPTTDTKQPSDILYQMNTLLLNKIFYGLVTGSTIEKFCLELYEDSRKINKINIGDELTLSHERKNSSVYSCPSYTRDCTQQIFNFEKTPFLSVGTEETVTVSYFVNPKYLFLKCPRLKEESDIHESTIQGLDTPDRNFDNQPSDSYPSSFICIKKEYGDTRKKAPTAKCVSESFDEHGNAHYLQSGGVKNYCNVKHVAENDIKQPNFSILCCLAGVRPLIGEKWYLAAQMLLQSLLDLGTSTVKARFLEKISENTWLVSLLVNGNDFATTMIERGIAEWDQHELKKFSSRKLSIQLRNPEMWEGERKVSSVSHVVTCDVLMHVYLQLKDCMPAFNDLHAKINKEAHLEHFEEFPPLNTFCLACYQDQVYRAQVLGYVPSECGKKDLLVVQFVDFGNILKISLSDARKMKNKHALIPKAAVCCVLSDIPSQLDRNDLILKLETFSEANVTFWSSCGDSGLASLKVTTSEGRKIFLKAYLESWNDDTTLNSFQMCEKPSRFLTNKPFLPIYKKINEGLTQTTRKVYVSHIVNPGHLYCRLVDSSSDFVTLVNNMGYYYASDRAEDMITTITPGLACVAKDTHGVWSRAVVQEVVDKWKVEVQYVDYGNQELLPHYNIRKSQRRFRFLPMQAIQCYLANVIRDSTAWNDKDMEELSSRVKGLEFSATFLHLVSEEDNIHEIKLRLSDGNLFNDEYVKLSNLSNTISLYCMQDENDGLLDETKRRERRKTPDYVVKSCSIKIMPGMVKKAHVSYADNPNYFFVQLLQSKNELDLISDLVQSDAKLEQDTAQSIKDLLVLYSFCIARHSSDDKWYRGQVLEMNDENATIFFIDYGDIVTLEWGHMKQVSKRTAEIPMQAILCNLKNISELEEEVLDTAVDVFLDDVLYLNNLVEIEFVEKRIDGRWDVVLTVDGELLSQKLSSLTVEDVRERSSQLDLTPLSSDPVNGSQVERCKERNESSLFFHFERLVSDYEADLDFKLFQPSACSTVYNYHLQPDVDALSQRDDLSSTSFFSEIVDGSSNILKCTKFSNEEGLKSLQKYFRNFCEEVRSCLSTHLPKDVVIEKLNSALSYLNGFNNNYDDSLRAVNASGDAPVSDDDTVAVDNTVSTGISSSDSTPTETTTSLSGTGISSNSVSATRCLRMTPIKKYGRQLMFDDDSAERDNGDSSSCLESRKTARLLTPADIIKGAFLERLKSDKNEDKKAFPSNSCRFPDRAFPDEETSEDE